MTERFINVITCSLFVFFGFICLYQNFCFSQLERNYTLQQNDKKWFEEKISSLKHDLRHAEADLKLFKTYVDKDIHPL